jgi:hypothetical protein
MNATESPEMKQYRTVTAVTRTVVLLGVVAALAAIGAHSPDASLASTNCASKDESARKWWAESGGAASPCNPVAGSNKWPDSGSIPG